MIPAQAYPFRRGDQDDPHGRRLPLVAGPGSALQSTVGMSRSTVRSAPGECPTMPPITLNRRRFLGCSAAAGLALSQGRVGEGASELAPIRLGVIGLGTRGTTLLRTLLELPATQVTAICDSDAK